MTESDARDIGRKAGSTCRRSCCRTIPALDRVRSVRLDAADHGHQQVPAVTRGTTTMISEIRHCPAKWA